MNPHVQLEAAQISTNFEDLPGVTASAASLAVAAANTQALIDLICEESVDASKRVGWLDEMTPASRVTVVAYLQALKNTMV